MGFTLAIATAISAASSIAAGIAGAAASREQAKVAQRNAQIAEINAQTQEINAERALLRGGIAAQEQDEQTLALLGQQEAVQSSSGLRGQSQLGARRTARRLGRLDALRVVDDSRREEFNFKVAAENFRTEAANQRSAAAIEKAKGRFSLLEGFLNAGQSVVGGLRRRQTAQGTTPLFPTPLHVRGRA